MFGGARRWSDAERRRGVALAALALLALILHAGLLGGLEWPVSQAPTPGAAPPALTVRMLAPLVPAVPAVPVAPAVAQPQAPTVAASSRPAPTAAPGAAIALASAAARPRAATTPVARAEPLPASAEPVVPEPSPPVPQAVVEATNVALPAPPEVALPAALPSTSASDHELPLYRTLIPPPTRLRYTLRRGAQQGSADFEWSPDGERYEARLEGQLAGVTALTQVSQGGFDESGVAPLRFTDRRGVGALQAANFQREAGKISFSGPSVQYPLLMGSQDRLSWMVQLAAVLAAEPQRLAEGGKVVINVIGARGDSSLWVFRFAGMETLTAGAGTIKTAHFAREATDPYDTRVDVWIDPLRHHLPARALLRSGPGDEGLELMVQEPVAVP